MYDPPAPTAEMAALLARCVPAGHIRAQPEQPLLLDIISTAALRAVDTPDAPARPHRALASFATVPLRPPRPDAP